MKAELSKKAFYILSWTWGLPMSLYGAVVAFFLIITGHKPMRWDYCVCFEVGHGWGGMEMGMFFVTERGASAHLKCHEHGHGIQNCYFGPLMPIIVCFPSSVRYWARRFIGFVSPVRFRSLPDYDAVWFEGQASQLGKRLHGWRNDSEKRTEKI